MQDPLGVQESNRLTSALQQVCGRNAHDPGADHCNVDLARSGELRVVGLWSGFDPE
jgi:hypothetical protein